MYMIRISRKASPGVSSESRVPLYAIRVHNTYSARKRCAQLRTSRFKKKHLVLRLAYVQKTGRHYVPSAHLMHRY